MQSDEVTEVTDNNSDERSNSELQNSQTPSPPTPTASLAQNASALAMAAQLSASNNAQAAALGLGKCKFCRYNNDTDFHITAQVQSYNWVFISHRNVFLTRF